MSLVTASSANIMTEVTPLRLIDKALELHFCKLAASCCALWPGKLQLRLRLNILLLFHRDGRDTTSPEKGTLTRSFST
jgi:hypothetical protein